MERRDHKGRSLGGLRRRLSHSQSGFCLLEKYGVGLISIGKTDLRVAFSCLEKEDVQELFDTVLQGVKDLES